MISFRLQILELFNHLPPIISCQFSKLMHAECTSVPNKEQREFGISRQVSHTTQIGELMNLNS